MGYYLWIMGYLKVSWPIVLGYLAFQVGVGDFLKIPSTEIMDSIGHGTSLRTRWPLKGFMVHIPYWGRIGSDSMIHLGVSNKSGGGGRI